MSTLVPGVLLKFLDAMKTGTKPTGKLLQVTDIVPADLDEKTFMPLQGFHLKVSDSTHSIYGSLPLEQDDLVLSNKIQLGQFIHIDRLEPGSPVPLLRGVKPISGRNPLLGTPELITGVSDERGKAIDGKSKKLWGTKVDKSGNLIPSVSNSASDCSALSDKIVYPKKENRILSGKKSSMLVDSNAKFQRSRSTDDQRPPWIPTSSSNLENKILKRKALTPATSPSYNKLRRQLSSSTSCDDQKTRSGIRGRLSSSTSCDDKKTSSRIRRLLSSSTSCDGQKTSSRIRRRLSSYTSCDDQKTSSRIRRRLSPSTSCDDQRTSSRIRRRLSSYTSCDDQKTSSQIRTLLSSSISCDDQILLTLPGNLSSLGKEVKHQREATQKMAFEVLRDLSASETIVQVLTRISELCSIGRPDEPSETLVQFLDVHRQISQAVIEMEAVLAATSTTVLPKDDSSALGEIDSSALSAKEPQVSKKHGKKSKTGTLIRSLLHKNVTDRENPPTAENERIGNGTSSLSNLIKLGKKIETELANCFMEFLEKALEMDTKGSRVTAEHEGRKGGFCDQSLILNILNWVEMEQADSNKRHVHPKAASVTRKLSIEGRKPQVSSDLISPVTLHLLGN